MGQHSVFLHGSGDVDFTEVARDQELDGKS